MVSSWTSFDLMSEQYLTLWIIASSSTFPSRTPHSLVSKFHPTDCSLFFSIADSQSSPDLFLVGCPRAQPLAVLSSHTHTLVDLIGSHGFTLYMMMAPTGIFPDICYDKCLCDITTWTSNKGFEISMSKNEMIFATKPAFPQSSRF